MGTLLNKSNEILNEKTTKIIPENIKEGIQIFDIVGTYSGSAVGGDVKRFNTIEEMNQDPNPQDEDLAVVYSNGTKPYSEEMNNDIGLKIFYIMNTVTLDNSISKNYVTYTLYSGKGFIDPDMPACYYATYYQSNKNKYYFVLYIGTEYYEPDLLRLDYDSTDGKTFNLVSIRGSLYDPNSDFITLPQKMFSVDVNVDYETGETTITKVFDNNIGNFFITPDVAFQGLYQYKNDRYTLAITQFDVDSSDVVQGLCYSNDGVIEGTLANGNSNADRVKLDKVFNLYNRYDNITVGSNGSELLSNWSYNKLPSRIDVTNITTNLTNMLFNSGVSDIDLSNWDISNWDMTNVLNASGLLQSCNNITNLNLSNWNLCNCVNMAYVFSRCRNLTQLNTDSWNLCNCTNMYRMFTTSGLSNISMTNWNLNNLPYLADIAVYTDPVTTIDIVDTYMPNVSYIGELTTTRNLRGFNITNCNISNLHSIGSLGNATTNLKVNINNSDIGDISYMQSTFANSDNLYLDLNIFNYNNKIDIQNLFYNCKINDDVLHTFETIPMNLNMCENAFRFSNIVNLDLSNKHFILCTSFAQFYQTFANCVNLTNIRFNVNEFPQFTEWESLRCMFMGCNKLDDGSIDLIINLCVQKGSGLQQGRNLSNINRYSPFYQTNISNTRYQNRWAELDAAGWTY